MPGTTDLDLRHALATLAYRASKVMRDAPPDFSVCCAGDGSRTAGEILAHMGDLMDWAMTQLQGKEVWVETPARSWDADVTRFHDGLSAIDRFLESGSELHASPAKVFQGAVADALTHTGQLAMLRRLAGARVRAENYSRAEIAVGQTGMAQPKARAEFGN